MNSLYKRWERSSSSGKTWRFPRDGHTVLIDRYKSWAWAVVTMRIENEMSEEQLHIAVDFCPSGTSVCANWEVQGRRRRVLEMTNECL